MTLAANEIISALTTMLGPANVVSDAGRMGAWLNEPRKRFHTSAVVVVTPPDVAAVQALMWFPQQRCR